jgi:hypothetical protein
MDRQRDETYAKTESTVEEGMRRAGTDAAAVVRIIAEEVALDLRKSGTHGTVMLSTISALADGTARGAADAGAAIGPVAEGFMVGAMLGAGETAPRSLAVIGHAAESFAKHARQVGYDSSATARGLVGGAVTGARSCGLGEVDAADAAAQGVARASDDMDPETGRKLLAELAADRYNSFTAPPWAGLPPSRTL